MVVLVVSGCGSIGSAGAPGPTRMVVVASRDLYPGVVVEGEDVYAVQVTGAFPTGPVVPVEDVLGAVVAFPILWNEPIRPEVLSSGEVFSLSDRIPRGLRLLEVPGSADVAIPGDYVDTWVTPAGGVPCTVAQALLVVPTADLVAPHRVGLLAAEHQARALAVASRDPSFRLTSRGTDGTTRTESPCSP